MSLEDVKEESLGLAIAAAAEARAVFAELVLPTWGTDRHGWPRTLYGQVMGGFSLLDRFSQLAVADDRQTPRMVEFAVRWLKYDPMLSNIAVQMWRHGLMHTGQPQRLIDSRAGNTWRWLLHWGSSHLPREQHMTWSTSGPGENILNFALLHFLDDLHASVDRWFRTLKDDVAEAERIVAYHAQLAEHEITLPLDL